MVEFPQPSFELAATLQCQERTTYSVDERGIRAKVHAMLSSESESQSEDDRFASATLGGYEALPSEGGDFGAVEAEPFEELDGAPSYRGRTLRNEGTFRHFMISRDKDKI